MNAATRFPPLLAAASRAERTVHTGVPMLRAQIDLMLGFMGVDG